MSHTVVAVKVEQIVHRIFTLERNTIFFQKLEKNNSLFKEPESLNVEVAVLKFGRQMR